MALSIGDFYLSQFLVSYCDMGYHVILQTHLMATPLVAKHSKITSYY